VRRQDDAVSLPQTVVGAGYVDVGFAFQDVDQGVERCCVFAEAFSLIECEKRDGARVAFNDGATYDGAGLICDERGKVGPFAVGEPASLVRSSFYHTLLSVSEWAGNLKAFYHYRKLSAEVPEAFPLFHEAENHVEIRNEGNAKLGLVPVGPGLLKKRLHFVELLLTLLTVE
jgi:hypothetical protein